MKNFYKKWRVNRCAHWCVEHTYIVSFRFHGVYFFPTEVRQKPVNRHSIMKSSEFTVQVEIEEQLLRWFGSSSDRVVKHFTGSCVSVMTVIWVLFVESPYFSPLFEMKFFVMALHYLKCYPSQVAMARMFSVHAATARTKIWELLAALYLTFDSIKVIDFKNRWDGWTESPVAIVDTTECEIETPSLYEWEFYSGKSKQHSLKYEVAIDVQGSKILWVNGPYKGSIHDVTIFRDKLVKELKVGEVVLADKGYVGESSCCCPFKPPKNPDQIFFNSKHYKVRQVIERLFSRFKHFNIISQKFRNKSNYEQHKVAFYCIASIIQIDLMFHPLNKLE